MIFMEIFYKYEYFQNNINRVFKIELDESFYFPFISRSVLSF